MIGHPNSEAEESKIQIDTGLFVLLIHLFVQDRLLLHPLLHLRWFLKHLHLFVPHFFSAARAVAFYEPIETAFLIDSFPDWSMSHRSTHFSWHTSNWLREKRPRSKPFFTPTLYKSFLSPCDDTNDVPCISASPANRGWGQLSHCRQLLLAAVHIAFFSAFFLLGSSWQVLVPFRMYEIFLTCFSICSFLPSLFSLWSFLLGTWGLSFSFSTSWRIPPWSASLWSSSSQLMVILHCH